MARRFPSYDTVCLSQRVMLIPAGSITSDPSFVLASTYQLSHPVKDPELKRLVCIHQDDKTLNKKMVSPRRLHANAANIFMRVPLTVNGMHCRGLQMCGALECFHVFECQSDTSN